VRENVTMGQIDVLAPLIGGVLNVLAAGIGLATAARGRRTADQDQPDSGSMSTWKK
jgi:hypothetical protein